MQSPHIDSIEHWPLDRLVPYAKNARTHSDQQVSQIAGSIAEFGFVNPILVGDDHVIVAGHGRLMAAQQLGMDSVPVIVLKHLTETQRRALVIADNQLASTVGWNEDLLHLELAELNDLGFDLDLIGFTDGELDRLLNLEPGNDDDANQGVPPIVVPEPPRNPVSRRGDLWILGDHRLLCGDSTNSADVKALFPRVSEDIGAGQGARRAGAARAGRGGRVAAGGGRGVKSKRRRRCLVTFGISQGISTA